MVWSSGPLGSAITIAVVLTTMGAISTIYWPGVFDTFLDDQLVLSNNSKSFSLWKVTPIPMYIEFYFFNWTNPKDIAKKNTKPILEEVGPYVFREHREKVVQDWFTVNDTVTYFQNRSWFFVPEKSVGPLSDVISTINVPAITAAFSMRDPKFALARPPLNWLFGFFGTKISVQKQVRELLFDGYSDPLLDLAKHIPRFLVPVAIPFDKFGWFYKRNNNATYDGLFNMFTGKDEIGKFGEIGEWNNENTTTFYKSYCAKVNGSAGEFFPPKQTKGSISIFTPDICRTITLNFKEEVEVNGISGYRYWGDDTMFDNSTIKPENWCFCQSEVCPPSGAIDISTCKWGAPAFVSFPHFFHGDPDYRNAVIGMNPDESKHQMFIDLEPNSGVPLQVAAALQINILIQPMPEYHIFNKVPKIYFPAIWFKQTALIDDVIGPEVKLLSIISSLGYAISYSVLTAGLSIFLIIGICTVSRKFRNDEDRVILVNTE